MGKKLGLGKSFALPVMRQNDDISAIGESCQSFFTSSSLIFSWGGGGNVYFRKKVSCNLGLLYSAYKTNRLRSKIDHFKKIQEVIQNETVTLSCCNCEVVSWMLQSCQLHP